MINCDMNDSRILYSPHFSSRIKIKLRIKVRFVFWILESFPGCHKIIVSKLSAQECIFPLRNEENKQ
jgi:hypothetical protein